MMRKKILLAIGCGVLGSQGLFAETARVEKAVPLCLPTLSDCVVQTVASAIIEGGCNKHEASGPIVVSAVIDLKGTGIDQPCKAAAPETKTEQ